MKLLNKEEKKELIETFRDVKNGRDGTGQFTADGWRKFYNKKYDYIMTDNGTIVEVERPCIDKVVYYDDELDDPLGENKKGNWILYNMKNFHDFGIDRWRVEKKSLEEVGCCSGIIWLEPFWETYESSQGYKRATPRFLKGWNWDKPTDDLISTEEIDELISIIDELKENYKKRLETYWKKYGENVYSYGYWANR